MSNWGRRVKSFLNRGKSREERHAGTLGDKSLRREMPSITKDNEARDKS